MSEPKYAVTGIPRVDGEPLPTRREITDFFKGGAGVRDKQVSLFVWAMTEFKAMDIHERLSFFQIAGIHSYPLVKWDGIEVPETPKDAPFPGYCNHNRVTFPTWHRPYMLLYEQVIHSVMRGIIDKWEVGSISEEKMALWYAAADSWRLPYWDWGQQQSYTGKLAFGIPEVCTTRTINIKNRYDQSYDALSPFLGFENPVWKDEYPSMRRNRVPMGHDLMGEYKVTDNIDEEHGINLPWSKCIGVSRYGIFSDQPPERWAMGINDWESANEAMDDPWFYKSGSGRTFSDAIGRMLSENYLHTWEDFSATLHNKPNNATGYMSIEYLHNIVHNCAGGLFMGEADLPDGDHGGNNPGFKGLGLGHLSDVPVAAFDPIFWFHHCNIDRLIAMWQTFNPDKWFNNPRENEHGQLDPTADAPLLPFSRDEKGTQWTSTMTRKWTDLNYQYDDLVPKPEALNPDGSVNQERYIADLRAHVNKLYPFTPEAVKESPGYSRSGGAEFNDYIINVVYDRYALKGRAYAIMFFLGEPPKYLSSYRQSDTFVGQVFTFSAPAVSEEGGVACANCAAQQEAKVLSKAHIPLTIPLVALSSNQSRSGGGPALFAEGYGPGLGGLDPEPVTEILRNMLQWVFVEIGGKRRPASDFPNTEIAVMMGTGTQSTNTRAQRFSGYKKISRATETKHLGFGYGGARSVSLIQDDED